MTGSETAGEPKKAQVVRDSTFCRFVADSMVLTPLGRELEVAFLQMGPLFHTVVKVDDGDEFQADAVLTEVARMRIGYQEFFKEFMDFAKFGILAGRIKGEAVANQIMEWSKEAEGAGPDAEPDAE